MEVMERRGGGGERERAVNAAEACLALSQCTLQTGWVQQQPGYTGYTAKPAGLQSAHSVETFVHCTSPSNAEF